MTRDLDLSVRRERAITLELRALDAEAGSFRAALSSDKPIRIWRDLDERLIHTTEAVDLARAVGGLPLLWQYNQHQPIGRVDDLELEGGVLRGTFTFAPNPKAQEVRADVAAGFLRNVSIGYRVHDWIDKDDGRLVEATRWELLEASIVSVPADPSVGLNRAVGGASTSGGKMDKENEGAAPPATPPAFTGAQELARRAGIEEGRQAEIERRNAIDMLFIGERFQAPEFQAIRRAALDDLRAADWAKHELLRAFGAHAAPVAGGSTFTQGATQGRGGVHVQAGEDAIERFMRGADLALSVRGGLVADKDKIREARGGEFASLPLAELAREYCRVAGIRTEGLSRDRIVGKAFSSRGIINQVAGDFPGLLENIANKALLLGYEEPGETWRMIARPGNLSDFREASRPGLSEFDDLERVRDGAEYRMGKFSDRVEKIQLSTFGKLFRITRQAIVNDDLGAFTTIPRKMGRAASRTVGDQVYAVLTSNPTMNQDSTALFDAAHSNLIASGNGAPSVAQLDTMKTTLARQKDSSAQTNGLNIRLARVVVPVGLEGLAQQLRIGEWDPSSSATNSSIPNHHRGTFEVVSDARLDTASSSIWYGLANPDTYDVIEVGFLDGQQEPYLEEHEGWTIDGIEYKVRIDCAAIPLDFRTMVRNNG
jgi:HK97 family phage prohead protease